MVNRPQVGECIPELAYSIVSVVQERITGKPTIISDGWDAHSEAVSHNFGRHVAHFGQLVKTVRALKQPVKEGYGPGKVVTCKEHSIYGEPELAGISTSRIERHNWTLRTHTRRLTRMSNGFSLKLDNLKAAVSLHFCAYNFCRIHRTLAVTPAMAAGIADCVWGIDDLVPLMRVWTFRDFVKVLEDNGFALHRTSGVRHVYKGVVNGQTQTVVAHIHRMSDEIKIGTLRSMIRQSCLPKKLFR